MKSRYDLKGRTDGGDGGDNLAKLELVKDGGLAGSVRCV